MELRFNLTRKRVGLIAALVALITATGMAYAAIPDADGNMYACKLNTTGTIRLIDKSLSESSLLSKCTRYETELSWNKGAKGDPGPQGPTGPAGPEGARGPAGSDGRNGADGINGQDGVDGIDGEDGRSCIDADGTLAAPACQGPQGQQGAQGPQGPAGPAGPAGQATVPSGTLTGYKRIQTNVDNWGPAGTLVTATATCPEGMIMIGGGSDYQGGQSTWIEDEAIYNFWRASVRKQTDFQALLQVYVHCVVVTP